MTDTDGWVGIFARLLVFTLGVVSVWLGAPQAQRADVDFPFSFCYAGGKAQALKLETIDETSREGWKGDPERKSNRSLHVARLILQAGEVRAFYLLEQPHHE